MNDEPDEGMSRKQAEQRVSEIRLMALAEIATKNTGIDADRLYFELHDIKRRPLSSAWLEASVMLAIIRRARPARVFGWLGKLRDRSNGEKEKVQFDIFEKRLRDYLHPQVLTNHGYGDATFAGLDHASIWETIRTHISALSDEKYDVFLNSGTLLGVIRDKRLIDHDDDVDLAVLLKADNEADAAAEWKALRGVLEEADLFERSVQDQPAIYKLRPAGKIEFDLFPAWIEAGKVYVYPHTHGTLTAADVLPLGTCDVTGQPIPRAPDKMLEINYGPGWRAPDPLFKFPWEAANTAFAGFLERLNR
jgi:hypothetical protein